VVVLVGDRRAERLEQLVHLGLAAGDEGPAGAGIEGVGERLEPLDQRVGALDGGRQVDGQIATLDALPGVVEAVAGRVPVLFDSGVRGGADIFKALALGASAVLIGRPYAYGLAIAGEAGVGEVLDNFAADFDLTMGLAGVRTVADIDRTALALRP
jgi:lactate 2-monooxygenase